MKTKLFKSGLIIGTLAIVAGKGYLSYRYYNLTDIDLELPIDKANVDKIVNEAKQYCTKNTAQLWAY